jgi:hypothetical protein
MIQHLEVQPEWPKFNITLYSRNSAGGILEWSGTVYSLPEGMAMLEIVAGQIQGSKTKHYVEITEGKNIGKSNETTPYEQGIRDLEGRVLKLRRKGYKLFEDVVPKESHGFIMDLGDSSAYIQSILEQYLPVNNTDLEGYEKPMKAQPYYKDENKTVRINFPCIGQPKINGFRCTARLVVSESKDLFSSKNFKIEFKSKNGLTYKDLDHIEAELLSIYTNPDINGLLASVYGLELTEVIFDGEMYIKGEKLDVISSAVRKKNENTPRLKYVVFDLAIPNYNQIDRLKIIRDTFLLQGETKNVLKISSTNVMSDNEAQFLTDAWIEDGFEGGIFRDKTADYKFGKRPMTMVKLKRKESLEFKIIDVVEGDKNPGVGVFVCEAENGEFFKVNPEGTIERRMEYFTNREDYIGKLLTVEFYERTTKGIPFHAVGITVRDYE